MRRPSTLRLLAAALGTIALASPAVAVTLDHASVDCGFHTFASESLTGGNDTYTGVAYGYVVSATPGEAVSVRCYMSVDGVEASSTPAGSGTGAAVTAGQVTYTANETQTVHLCAEWTAGSESGSTCFDSVSMQMPPQEVVDLFDGFESQIEEEASLVEFNDGETGFLMQTIAEVELLLAMVRTHTGAGKHAGPPEGHDVMSSCTYKYVRHTGLIQVVGKTKAGRHPVAQATTIRCRLQNAATGAVLFDQTRTEPGTLARLEGSVVATVNQVVICNHGSGTWDDSHVFGTAMACR